MTRFPFLAQRLWNTPLAIHPRKAEVVVGVLAERLGIANLTRLNGEVVTMPAGAFYLDDDDEFVAPGPSGDQGYDVVEGIAVIPVCGTLVQKLGTVRPASGMSGYDCIRAAFLCAMEDPGARAIVLEIDSPGGEVAGLFDLCDEITAARGEKPIWAILNECAYSAGYALASCANRIIVPRTGGTGSIGVLCVHTDFSKALSGAGIKVTFIQSGARKSDGAPEKPLSDEALERFQADIDAMALMFFETVARNRGLTVDAVRAFEAGTFMGAAGVTQRLADDVMAPADAFRALLASLES
jgi:capsid assembly protease